MTPIKHHVSSFSPGLNDPPGKLFADCAHGLGNGGTGQCIVREDGRSTRTYYGENVEGVLHAVQSAQHWLQEEREAPNEARPVTMVEELDAALNKFGTGLGYTDEVEALVHCAIDLRVSFRQMLLGGKGPALGRTLTRIAKVLKPF